jgi:hypothetical protein
MLIPAKSTAILVLGFNLAVVGACSDDVRQSDSKSEEMPVILFDLGHNNYRYDYGIENAEPIFEQFISEHGFLIRELEGPISESALADVDIFHTDNALSPENVGNWSLPTPSAFTAAEIEVLLAWVRDGGSLLIVIEHMPMGGSYSALASALGVEISNGFAVDGSLLSDYSAETVAAAGNLLFSRADGTLADHAIVRGSRPFGPIEHLATDNGSAFTLPPESTSLLIFPANAVSLEPTTAWDFSKDTPSTPVAGWSQAGTMKFGNGRIAILGDSYLISAPAFLEPPYIEDEDEAERGAHNHQFTLNLYRWLSDQQIEIEAN